MKIKNWKNVFLTMTLFAAISCDDNDDGPMVGQFNGSDVALLQSAAQNGNWRVTRFVDDGGDETANFNGFVFTFNVDGSILADNGTDSFNGSWRIEFDDDDDDFGDDDLEFYITFSTPNNDLNELTEDWYVLEYSDNRIRLSDDDDDDDDDDELLIFERN